ncbi:MAG TPA: hypothetical protein VGI22_02815 [Xanthobacteraceae bacterium]|jgi:hypothetical protein
MTEFRVLDGYVISEAEYRARRGDLMRFLSARAAGKAPSAFALSNARELAADAPASVTPSTFTPIGKGLPLTIMIRDVYTGKHPSGTFFGDGADVALVSGVKNYDVFNASTRALNFLVENQARHSHMRRPAAFSDGSALVAYSPAIMTDSLTISFELAVATFPQALVSSLSKAFNTLAGIPILLPYAGYLLGAGQLFKLAGNAGHALFDGVKFSVTNAIDFDIPGSIPAIADFRVLATFDATQYRYKDGEGLQDRSGSAYDGDEPYIVVSLDGKQRDNLKAFLPTVASAAVLQRFFQVQDGAQVAIDSVVQGLQLTSDFKYREQAISLKAKLAAAPAADKPDIQKQLDAALKNISTDALKPA